MASRGRLRSPELLGTGKDRSVKPLPPASMAVSPNVQVDNSAPLASRLSGPLLRCVFCGFEIPEQPIEGPFVRVVIVPFAEIPDMP